MESRKELFLKTRALWPEEIKLSGDYVDGKFFYGGNLLNALYHRIDSTIEEGDEWLSVSIWAFHQALPDPEQSAYEYHVINICDVSYELYQEKMLDNLRGDPCWEQELKIYENLVPG